MMEQTNEMRAREIDLSDLLKHLMYKWRVFFTWIILSALLLGGLKIMKNIQEDRKALQQISQQKQTEPAFVEVKKNDKPFSEMTYEEINEEVEKYATRSGLTVFQLENVKNALSIFRLYGQYDELIKAYDNSNTILTMMYWINADEDALAFISQDLIDYVNSGAIARDITKSGDTVYSEEYLVTVLSADYPGETVIENEKAITFMNGLLCIKISSGDTNEELAQLADGALMEHVSQMDAFEGLTVKLADSFEGNEIRESLEKKNEYVTKKTSAFESLSSYGKSFSDMEKTLFNLVSQSSLYVVKDSSLSTTLTSNDQNEYVKKIQRVSKRAGLLKFVLIGAFAGLFIPLVWYVLIYLFSDTVKQAKDFRQVFGLYVLGDVKIKKKRKGFGKHIDDWLDRMFKENTDDYEERLSMTIANLKAICRKNNSIDVFVNMTLSDRSHLGADLITELEKAGIRATLGKNVLRNVSAFEEMNKYDLVVLLEKPRSSKYFDVERTIAKCLEHDKKIIGVITC